MATKLSVVFSRHADKDWELLSKQWENRAQELWEKYWVGSHVRSYCSYIPRTQRTIYMALWADHDKTTEEIRDNLDYHDKPIVDPRLCWYFWDDCKTEKEREAYHEAIKSFKDTHDYFDGFILNKSDDWLVELDDPRISSYSKCAWDIAEIYLHYYQAKDKRINKVNNKMKTNNESWDINGLRLNCTHSWVIELFLMKLLEKKHPEDKNFVKNFIKDNGLSNGFMPCEFYRMDFSEGGMKLYYKDMDPIDVSEEDLKSIIKDRDNLYKKIDVLPDDSRISRFPWVQKAVRNSEIKDRVIATYQKTSDWDLVLVDDQGNFYSDDAIYSSIQKSEIFSAS